MDARTNKCDFSIFGRKFVFWENLVQTIKIVSLRRNLVARLIRISRIQWWCSLFLFETGNTLFWANLVQKIKIGSSMESSMLVFTFSVLYLKHPFLLSLRPCGSSDFKIGGCRQHFLLCCGECVRGLFLCTTLKIFK